MIFLWTVAAFEPLLTCLDTQAVHFAGVPPLPAASHCCMSVLHWCPWRGQRKAGGRCRLLPKWQTLCWEKQMPRWGRLAARRQGRQGDPGIQIALETPGNEKGNLICFGYMQRESWRAAVHSLDRNTPGGGLGARMWSNAKTSTHINCSCP